MDHDQSKLGMRSLVKSGAGVFSPRGSVLPIRQAHVPRTQAGIVGICRGVEGHVENGNRRSLPKDR